MERTDYEYDIFISYKQDRETLTLNWIQDHFLPPLSHWVGLELGREASIFVNGINEKIPAGADWPTALKDHLATSRVLLALWTKTYFNSRWCVEEFAHMLARCEHRDTRLIIPVLIHDGNDFPPALPHVQRLEIQQFYDPWMHAESKKAKQLRKTLREHATDFADAIANAPPWQQQWPSGTAQKHFRDFYKGTDPLQERVPVLLS